MPHIYIKPLVFFLTINFLFFVYFGTVRRTRDNVPGHDSFNDQGLRKNVQNVTENEQNTFANLLKCQNLRLERLHNECQKLGFKTDSNLAEYDEIQLKKLHDKFMADDTHKVLMRALPKTGSSSWKTILVENSPYFNGVKSMNVRGWIAYEKRAHLYKVLKYPKDQILKMWDNYFSFLTVRHPLSKLESGFKHIGVNDKHGPYYNEMRYNPDLFWEKFAGKRFQEFLKTLLFMKEEEMNQHYRSIVYSAKPCNFPWKFIAKTETIEQEMIYVIKTKLSGKGGPVHRNPGTDLRNITGDIQNVTKQLLPLFSQLENPGKCLEEIMTLQYGADMKLFGYSYVIEDGKVYATCDNFQEYGMCC